MPEKLRHRSPVSEESEISARSSSKKRGDRTWNHPSNATRVESVLTLLTSQSVLFNLPVLILVTIASLDNADKQLLASSFPMLEQKFHLDVQVLGYFSMFTNLSYAASLPFWGYLVHTYGIHNIHYLLSISCASWGLATIGIAASGTSIFFQAVFRALNGVALGSILPLSQTLLVELVDVTMRGRAFGFMGLCEKLAGTIAAASIIYFENWQHPYIILGLFSILMAAMALPFLRPACSSCQSDDLSKNKEPHKLTLRQIVRRIAKVPAFTFLVAQGVFGGTPWDMMSFILLLLDWRGFSKEQIVSIQFATGVSSTIGGWLGGLLGDAAQERIGVHGRIGVALVSVVGGIPLYGLFVFANSYRWALLWISLFNIWATWPPAGALRPLCAALTSSPSERAQIVSMWIVLEKASGAIFGAPLVGYLTSKSILNDTENVDGPSSEKSQALAWTLFGLSSLFWSICAMFWLLMGFSMKQDNVVSLHSKESRAKTREEIEMEPLV
jgi:MFS family permease